MSVLTENFAIDMHRLFDIYKPEKMELRELNEMQFHLERSHKLIGIHIKIRERGVTQERRAKPRL